MKVLRSLARPEYGPPLVFYGNGEFPSGGKGEVYVPCKWVKNACRQLHRCKGVDEFRTTQACPLCHQRLSKLSKDKYLYGPKPPGKRKILRSIVCCTSAACKSRRLMDRDHVGAHGIFIKGDKEDGDEHVIPQIYLRGGGLVWDEPQTEVMFNPPHSRH